MKEICVIGVGLIGGSFALDIKSMNSAVIVSGVDTNPTHLETALRLGVIDQIVQLESIVTADLVVLATPVDAAVQLLPQVLDLISESALVIDMGSTKSAICEVVSQHSKRSQFLAAHPIAGTEFSGPEAAVKGLYSGKTNIICELEKTAVTLSEQAIRIFESIGMRMRFMTANAHDKHIAYVSHLSHISSFMLGKTVIEKEKNERDIFDMAGSGFESTVRLAKSSPKMWTPIFEQNKTNVIETLEEYIHNLTQFKTLMENNDFEAVFNEMKSTNYIKTILKGLS
jgi:prephenate dehydrogenase